MILLLRFVGVINAAVWLGAAVFFTFGAPAMFTPEAKTLLGEAQSGIAAMMLLTRYFALQYWCGGIAIVHQLAEWVYLGRTLQRWVLGVLAAVYLLALLGGLWLQPKLRQLHEVKYGYRKVHGQYVRDGAHTQQQRDDAAAAFRRWHGISMVFNLIIMGGLVFFTWRVANPVDVPRFIPANKFRS